MSLIKIQKPEEQRPVTYDNEIAALIQRRRYQILVHSLLYYELDVNLVSDAQWAAWGVELAKLQEEHPKEAESVIFAEAFRGFDGSTGYHLPFRDQQIMNIAARLLSHQQDSAEAKDALYKLRYSVGSTPPEYEKYKMKRQGPAQVQVTKKIEHKEEKVVEQKPRKGLLGGPRKRDS